MNQTGAEKGITVYVETESDSHQISDYIQTQNLSNLESPKKVKEVDSKLRGLKANSDDLPEKYVGTIPKKSRIQLNFDEEVTTPELQSGQFSNTNGTLDNPCKSKEDQNYIAEDYKINNGGKTDDINKRYNKIHGRSRIDSSTKKEYNIFNDLDSMFTVKLPINCTHDELVSILLDDNVISINDDYHNIFPNPCNPTYETMAAEKQNILVDTFKKKSKNKKYKNKKYKNKRSKKKCLSIFSDDCVYLLFRFLKLDYIYTACYKNTTNNTESFIDELIIDPIHASKFVKEYESNCKSIVKKVKAEVKNVIGDLNNNSDKYYASYYISLDSHLLGLKLIHKYPIIEFKLEEARKLLKTKIKKYISEDCYDALIKFQSFLSNIYNRYCEKNGSTYTEIFLNRMLMQDVDAILKQYIEDIESKMIYPAKARCIDKINRISGSVIDNIGFLDLGPLDLCFPPLTNDKVMPERLLEHASSNDYIDDASLPCLRIDTNIMHLTWISDKGSDDDQAISDTCVQDPDSESVSSLPSTNGYSNINLLDLMNPLIKWHEGGPSHPSAFIPPRSVTSIADDKISDSRLHLSENQGNTKGESSTGVGHGLSGENAFELDDKQLSPIAETSFISSVNDGESPTESDNQVEIEDQNTLNYEVVNPTGIFEDRPLLLSNSATNRKSWIKSTKRRFSRIIYSIWRFFCSNKLKLLLISIISSLSVISVIFMSSRSEVVNRSELTVGIENNTIQDTIPPVLNNPITTNEPVTPQKPFDLEESFSILRKSLWKKQPLTETSDFLESLSKFFEDVKISTDPYKNIILEKLNNEKILEDTRVESAEDLEGFKIVGKHGALLLRYHEEDGRLDDLAIYESSPRHQGLIKEKIRTGSGGVWYVMEYPHIDMRDSRIRYGGTNAVNKIIREVSGEVEYLYNRGVILDEIRVANVRGNKTPEGIRMMLFGVTGDEYDKKEDMPEEEAKNAVLRLGELLMLINNMIRKSEHNFKGQKYSWMHHDVISDDEKLADLILVALGATEYPPCNIGEVMSHRFFSGVARRSEDRFGRRKYKKTGY